MGTTAQKLEYLGTTKSQLKDMINYGLDDDNKITSSTTFRNYVSSIFNAFLEALRTPDTLFTNLPKKSGSGAVISLNDTANAPMRIELSPSELTQDGTPTPDNPQDIHTISGSNRVVVNGKNLFDKDSAEDGKEISGTGIYTNSSWCVSDYIPVKNGETYIKNKGGGDNYLTYDSNKTQLNTSTLSFSSNKITINDVNVKYIRINLTIANKDTYQLELGTSSSSYEPYISQEADIDLSSKNLFTTRNNFSMITGYANYNVLGTNSLDVISTGNSYGYRYVRYQLNGLEVGKTYYVSAKFENSDKTTTSPLYIRNTADSSSLYANDSYTSGSKVSFTATETTAMIRFYASGGTAKINTCTWYDIMVSQDQNADFMPYYEPIEYCKIGNYEDRIFKNISGDTDYSNTREEGAWYIKKNIGKTIIDSSNVDNLVANFGQTNNKNRINIDKSKLGWQTSWTTGICLMNKYKEITSTSAVASGTFAFNFGQTIIIIWNDAFTDLATAKTELLGTEIYIAQATPTYTKITGTLANQLENVYQNLLSYSGTTNISQVNNDLSFNMSVQAIEE